ncbi:MAG TPA: hypothetical protein VK533_15545 [Sphingomonas sp.]|uniref:hypothetical protein n=1 Tax=Sphingomonas sp. TaxID=28214 RepID=UPI002CC23C87|nr:hypothetical protein [Sphingomonas sp.]HMI20946.1 hypothetical protein [Sphingomonas sp.]
MIVTGANDEVVFAAVPGEQISERAALKRACRSMKYCIASVILTLSLSTDGGASAPLAFISTGKWTLTGNDGQCFLTHAFSDGTSTSTLRIDQFPRQYGFRTTIIFEHPRGAHIVVSAKIGLDGNEKTRRIESTEIFNESDGLHRVYRTFLRPDDFDRAAKSGYLFVMPSGNVGLQIPVPQLTEAIIALRRCEQALIEASGLPPEEMRRIKSFPEPNGHIVKERFEQIPLEKNADPEDVAVSRGIIDGRGVTVSCEVIHRAKSETLNVEACRRIMNMKFDPAIDVTGNPVSAPFFIEAGWPMPSSSLAGFKF